ncbi:MAG TPA: zf-HC2 domain-containing protein [Acidobacteriota bacterium]|nr:zf-HC2 domain-containing protein [Acidobacteriota bacterium]
MRTKRVCDRRLLSDFLTERLEEEELLDFLFHLDECPRCWEEVYSAKKAAHPHYYKTKTKKTRISERELARLNRSNTPDDEIFEVA